MTSSGAQMKYRLFREPVPDSLPLPPRGAALQPTPCTQVVLSPACIPPDIFPVGGPVSSPERSPAVLLTPRAAPGQPHSSSLSAGV